MDLYSLYSRERDERESERLQNAIVNACVALAMNELADEKGKKLMKEKTN